MNWIDIIILVLILGGALLGWRNGVIRWLFTLAGAILGVIVAGRLYGQVQAIIPVHDSDRVRQMVAFGVIFVAILIAAWLLARVVKGVLNILLLGWIDNGAGLVIGALVGALSASAIISAVYLMPLGSAQSALSDSLLAETLLDSTSVILIFLPAEFDSITDLFAHGF